MGAMSYNPASSGGEANPSDALEEKRKEKKRKGYKDLLLPAGLQAEGLILACGLDAVQSALGKATVLAAHGPFTATGVRTHAAPNHPLFFELALKPFLSLLAYFVFRHCPLLGTLLHFS
jgi:hypothetical protein